ncbi:MAG TPA: hypothetical protein PLV25_00095, partial [Opitutales bacterium]|nr:hypothetical protein [Opitutales bacterium]
MMNLLKHGCVWALACSGGLWAGHDALILTPVVPALARQTAEGWVQQITGYAAGLGGVWLTADMDAYELNALLERAEELPGGAFLPADSEEAMQIVAQALMAERASRHVRRHALEDAVDFVDTYGPNWAARLITLMAEHVCHQENVHVLRSQTQAIQLLVVRRPSLLKPALQLWLRLFQGSASS